jgi:hypothetical protein
LVVEQLRQEEESAFWIAGLLIAAITEDTTVNPDVREALWSNLPPRWSERCEIKRQVPLLPHHS